MNKEEKKALISFLSIYILSSTFFMAVIAFMYFEREVVMLEDHCNMNMSQAAWEVKSDILKSYMDKKTYKFKATNKELNYAILRDDESALYSNLKYSLDINLSKKAHHGVDRSLHILEIDDKNIDLKYIIIEDTNGFDLITTLKFKVIFLFMTGFIIMSFFGFILSNILVKPVKQKAEKLNRFVKDSSHELNTPITALMMIISSLKNKYNIEEKTINQITASTKNIKQTYDKLLFNINGDIVQRFDEEFDLKEIIEENILFFDEIAKSKNIELSSSIESCQICMDKYSAKMVVNNLISNAIKYTKKNKKVYVELKDSKLRVKDEGIGIDKKMQKTIFTRYKRATNEEGGFGIGLDIVSSVCKDYEIDISLESQAKKGTSFTLNFSKVKC
jgi:two-component system OmpR family sensor kinase